MDIFRANYTWERPIRSIGVRGYDLVPAGSDVQLALFEGEEKREKLRQVELAMDDIRRRFGNLSVQRALIRTDRNLGK